MQLAENTLPTLPDNLPKIDIDKAVQYRLNGLTMAEIGKIFNCSKQAVSQALAPYKSVPKGYKTYKDRKAEILELKQYELVSSVDAAAIKKMQPYQAITAVGILEDKIRLIRGESTSNVSVHSVVDDLNKRKQELLDRLNTVDNSVDNADIKEGNDTN